jgi:hypothetical protein
MLERDYWLSLEYRICHEFAGMEDRNLRYLWCDGFIPARCLLDGPDPRITGRAWICNGQRQNEWTFCLFLPHPFRSLGEVDWASLLPPEDVTRWLALDPVGRRIQIDPAAAVPDAA